MFFIPAASHVPFHVRSAGETSVYLVPVLHLYKPVTTDCAVVMTSCENNKNKLLCVLSLTAESDCFSNLTESSAYLVLNKPKRCSVSD